MKATLSGPSVVCFRFQQSRVCKSKEWSYIKSICCSDCEDWFRKLFILSSFFFHFLVEYPHCIHSNRLGLFADEIVSLINPQLWAARGSFSSASTTWRKLEAKLSRPFRNVLIGNYKHILISRGCWNYDFNDGNAFLMKYITSYQNRFCNKNRREKCKLVKDILRSVDGQLRNDRLNWPTEIFWNWSIDELVLTTYSSYISNMCVERAQRRYRCCRLVAIKSDESPQFLLFP